ncbi:methylthioribulose 1-phosphate dehydratase [Streptomyces sp. NPDC056883]|uniref:methylthioribulose 1-phosphate dehydratase n=1 Tax=Streptomyces sp. NPDC056883 TaxID=3345959 RepID=UPI0036B3A0FD
MTVVPDTSMRPGLVAEAAELAKFSRLFYERGWMPGTSGNLSVRLRGEAADTALITASGRDKGELTPGDVVAVHAATGELLHPGALRASAETSIHAAVYRTTPARAVIHVHSPYATVMACRAADRERLSTLELTRFELLKGLGLDARERTAVPVFPNWPHVPRIADEVAGHLSRADRCPPGLLIADHGITVWGSDLAQARNRLECFEAICQLLAIGVG